MLYLLQRELPVAIFFIVYNHNVRSTVTCNIHRLAGTDAVWQRAGDC